MSCHSSVVHSDNLYWLALTLYISCFGHAGQEAVLWMPTMAASGSQFIGRPVLGTSGCTKERKIICIIIYIKSVRKSESVTYYLCEAVDQVLLAACVWWGAQRCLCSLWVWRSGAPVGTWQAMEAGFVPSHPPNGRAPPVSWMLMGSGWWVSEAEVCSQSRWRSGYVGWALGGDQSLHLLLWRKLIVLPWV